MTIRRPNAAVVTMILLLAVFNAADFCKAALPRHPCCPASGQQSPEQQAPESCAKLGCFMSAPVLRVAPQALSRLPLSQADRPNVPRQFAAYAAPASIWVSPAFDRSILFRRLLI